MAKLIALLTLAITCVAVEGAPPRPVFSRRYTAKGVVTLPSSELRKIRVYHDGDAGRSRIDYQDENFSMISYQFAKDAGVEFILGLESEGKKCGRVTGNAKETLKTIGGLPDLSGYQFKGSEHVGKDFAERWERIDSSPGVMFSHKHIMWVRNQNSLAVPVRYSVQRINRMLFVETDRYIIDYEEYSPKVNHGHFKLPINPDDCWTGSRGRVDAEVKALLEKGKPESSSPAEPTSSAPSTKGNNPLGATRKLSRRSLNPPQNPKEKNTQELRKGKKDKGKKDKGKKGKKPGAPHKTAPLNPDDKTTAAPFNPEDKKPGAPSNPADKKPGAPQNPADKTPAAPLNPEDKKPLPTIKPAEKEPGAPQNPADERPTAPLNPEDKKPGAPSNPTDKKPYHTINPAEKEPGAPQDPADKTPAAPLNPEGKKPGAFLNPADKKPGAPQNPAGETPAAPLNPADKKPPHTIKPADKKPGASQNPGDKQSGAPQNPGDKQPEAPLNPAGKRPHALMKPTEKTSEAPPPNPSQKVSDEPKKRNMNKSRKTRSAKLPSLFQHKGHKPEVEVELFE